MRLPARTATMPSWTTRSAAASCDYAPRTEDFRAIGDGAVACFHAGSFGAATRLAAAIGALDGVEDHRPDIDVRDGDVTVRLLTFNEQRDQCRGGDVELARAVSAAAREHGATSDPGAVQSVLVIVESIHNEDVMPFWKALLGLRLPARQRRRATSAS